MELRRFASGRHLSLGSYFAHVPKCSRKIRWSAVNDHAAVDFRSPVDIPGPCRPADLICQKYLIYAGIDPSIPTSTTFGGEVQGINTLEELAHVLKADFSRYDTARDTGHAALRLNAAVSKVAQAIKHGDRSAVAIGYSLLMEDPHLPFGKILKSNIARALKHHIELLNEHEKLGLAGKTAELLSLQFCPREVEDYCRLVKKMGRAVVSEAVIRSRPINEKARSLLGYLSEPKPERN
jgi:hypothetical protein